LQLGESALAYAARLGERATPTIARVLFTPDRHEPLADRSFSEAAAREAIARIAARAEQELDAADGRWPRDPADAQRPGEGRASSLYWGAAGVYWALDELAAAGYVAPGLVGRELVEALEARLREDPDDPDFGYEGVWFGVAGVLAVAERKWPDASRRDRLADLARASLVSPALEPMLGHPGHMLLASQLHARTGEERWTEFWSAGAERLLGEWRYDDALGAWLWTQLLGSHESRYVGAAHGLVGNVHVLRRGRALLPAGRRDEVERRSVETLTRLAVVEDGRANWPGVAGSPLIRNERIRVQWCHGAPGVLTAMWDAAAEDDAWGELLLAAGRLVWEAGPIRDAPGLCHGTAGNAYALLALWRRTDDERWLERARAFAQHAAAQVEERAARLGHGRHSLFTGDEGVALCLASCVEGDERLPVADRLI
jgi:Lanthionine synthetase C-like protein